MGKRMYQPSGSPPSSKRVKRPYYKKTKIPGAINGRVKPERKYFDYASTAIIPNYLGTSWTGQNINDIQQGAGSDDIDGMHAVMKSLDLCYEVRAGAATTGDGFIRLVVIYAKESTPTSGEIFATDAFNSWRNLDNTHQFVTIYDKAKPIQITNGNKSCLFKKHIKLNHLIKLSTTGTTVTNGQIYAFAIPTVFAGGAFTANWNSRVRFLDG